MIVRGSIALCYTNVEISDVFEYTATVSRDSRKWNDITQIAESNRSIHPLIWDSNCSWWCFIMGLKNVELN